MVVRTSSVIVVAVAMMVVVVVVVVVTVRASICVIFAAAGLLAGRVVVRVSVGHVAAAEVGFLEISKDFETLGQLQLASYPDEMLGLLELL